MDKVVEKETVYMGTIFDIVKDSKEHQFIKTPPGVAAMVYDTVKDKYIFVEQYRGAVDGKMLEIVAGKIDKGETPEEAVKREIVEETGYKVDRVDLLQEFYSCPGMMDEVVSLFYVEVSERIDEGGGVDDEEIKVVEVDKLGYGGNIFMESGEGDMTPPYRVIDAKTIIAINHVEHNKVMKDTVDVLTQAKLRTF
jgi:ADP-ribose pyrophosphatase